MADRKVFLRLQVVEHDATKEKEYTETDDNYRPTWSISPPYSVKDTNRTARASS